MLLPIFLKDKTIGKRCCRISGAVSAANYLEVPREARTAPLNLTGRFVYIQVRERSGWGISRTLALIPTFVRIECGDRSKVPRATTTTLQFFHMSQAQLYERIQSLHAQQASEIGFVASWIFCRNFTLARDVVSTTLADKQPYAVIYPLNKYKTKLAVFPCLHVQPIYFYSN